MSLASSYPTPLEGIPYKPSVFAATLAPNFPSIAPEPDQAESSATPVSQPLRVDEFSAQSRSAAPRASNSPKVRAKYLKNYDKMPESPNPLQAFLSAYFRRFRGNPRA